MFAKAVVQEIFWITWFIGISASANRCYIKSSGVSSGTAIYPQLNEFDICLDLLNF